MGCLIPIATYDQKLPLTPSPPKATPPIIPTLHHVLGSAGKIETRKSGHARRASHSYPAETISPDRQAASSLTPSRRRNCPDTFVLTGC